MSFSWFVARRYLTARRRQAFISLISGVSILGVGVGVMALIIALALMTGVQTELQDRLVGSSAHVYVNKYGAGFEDLDAERQKLMVPGVIGMSPIITGHALLDASRSQAQPAVLKGIDPVQERTVTGIDAALKSGSLDALVNRPADARDGVVLGSMLATRLGAQVGDTLWATTTQLTSTPTTLVPRRRFLEVVGIVSFGVYQVDDTHAFVSLETAKQLLDREAPDMLQLRLTDMHAAKALREQLQISLGADYFVQDWTEINGDLYAALWLEKLAISLTIGLIVMVAALNIVASLVLLVMEKTRDIAILRTMGAPARMIRRVFMYQGLAIGLIGTGAGTILGLLVCFIFDRYEVIKLPEQVYQITYLPFRVEPWDVVTVVAGAVLVCFVATIYPSRQAGRIDPAEALRNQ
jgi:lipoprotein-releasing system permease protein